MKILNKPRFIAVLMALTLIFSIAITYARNVEKDLSNSVLRLHILANSDSKEDQQLKLKVRDKVIEGTKDLFSSAGEIEETKELAKENIDLIKKMAEDEVKNLGYDYPITVEIGHFPFPTKVYGNVMLPSGNYDAVRILIGEAKGRNWWCVMFPPLCFVNGTVKMPEVSEEQLKNSLTEDEYSLITQSNDEMDVQVKFKLVELWGKLMTKCDA